MITIIFVVLLNVFAAKELFPDSLQLQFETPEGPLQLSMHQTTNTQDAENLDMKAYEYEASSVAMFYTYNNDQPTTYFFGTIHVGNKMYLLVPQIFSDLVPSKNPFFTTSIENASYSLLDSSQTYDFEALITRISRRVVVIDVAIFADFSVYKWFNESRKGVVVQAKADIFYFSVAVVAEMEKIFRRMQDPKLFYKVQLVDLKILDKPSSLLTEEEDLDYKESLQALPRIVDNISSKLIDHDALFLLTMHPPKTGIGAEVCGDCGDVSTGVVWGRGVHGAAQRAARVLALSYGVPIDTKECKGLMSENFLEYFLNDASFSTCSSAAIQQHFLSTLKGKHRFSRFHTSKEKGAFYKKYNLGSRFSANEQCKQIFGSESFYCTGGEMENKEMCQKLLCYDSKKRNCVYTSESVTLKGTRCGSDSQCQDAKCVPVRNLPPNNCLYGDSVFAHERSSFSEFCSTITSSFTHKSCQLQQVRDLCCSSCS